MLQRHVRAPSRGDDWGCCPFKQQSSMQHENEAGVPYKNSQADNEDRDASHSSVRTPWNADVGEHSPDNGSNPVTAAVGLDASVGAASTCFSAPVYAAGALTVVTVGLIVALVAVLVRRRRQRQHSGAGASNDAGEHWNKKLAGILTPAARRNLLRPQPKPTAPKSGYGVAESPKTASSTLSSASSSKRPLATGGNSQRHGYIPLPGAVYPAATTGATQWRDPNPYGLPASQCSYQPPRVKFVTLHRHLTVDSLTGGVDVDDNDDEVPPSNQYTEADSEVPTNDLQTLLPLVSLRSLFGVVSGVFGLPSVGAAPAFGRSQQPTSVDHQISSTATHRTAPGVDGANNASAASSALHIADQHIDGTHAALKGDNNVSAQPESVSRDMGINVSAEPTPLTGTTPPVQSSPNDFESLDSVDAVDNVHAASMATLASSSATQSAVASDLDAVPVGSDDAVSPSTQSLRQSVGEKLSTDGALSTRRQSAQSAGSATHDVASRQTTLERIGGLADAFGLGDFVRSVTGGQPAEADKVEPFWVPPDLGLQIQKRRAQSLQSSLLLSQFDTSNASAKNGELQTCLQSS